MSRVLTKLVRLNWQKTVRQNRGALEQRVQINGWLPRKEKPMTYLLEPAANNNLAGTAAVGTKRRKRKADISCLTLALGCYTTDITNAHCIGDGAAQEGGHQISGKSST